MEGRAGREVCEARAARGGGAATAAARAGGRAAAAARLGRHVLRSADHRLRRRHAARPAVLLRALATREPLGGAEVGEHGVAVEPEQHVLGLEVAVDHRVLLVEVLERERHLPEDDLRAVLGELVARGEVGVEVAAAAVREQQVEVRRVLERVVQPHDVRVARLLQNRVLLDDARNLRSGGGGGLGTVHRRGAVRGGGARRAPS